jgi:hypothetical protein
MKLHSEKLHNLHPPLNIIRMIKSRIRCTGQVAHIVEMTVVRKSEEEKHCMLQTEIF